MERNEWEEELGYGFLFPFLFLLWVLIENVFQWRCRERVYKGTYQRRNFVLSKVMKKKRGFYQFFSITFFTAKRVLVNV